MFRAALLALCCVAGAGAADPQRQWAAYPAKHETEAARWGAEFLARTVWWEGSSFVTPKHLVVEILIELKAGKQVHVAHSHFRLLINSSEHGLLPQPPGFVAAGLKYPDWNHQRGVQVAGGVGDKVIIVGGPDTSPRFPDDRRPSEDRLPPAGQPPRTGAGQPGNAKQPRTAAPDAVLAASLREGESKGPVAGILYFPYSEKTKGIKKLVLAYEGPAGSFRLNLYERPSAR